MIIWDEELVRQRALVLEVLDRELRLESCVGKSVGWKPCSEKFFEQKAVD